MGIAVSTPTGNVGFFVLEKLLLVSKRSWMHFDRNRTCFSYINRRITYNATFSIVGKNKIAVSIPMAAAHAANKRQAVRPA